jgi:hypothetical protein
MFSEANIGANRSVQPLANCLSPKSGITIGTFWNSKVAINPHGSSSVRVIRELLRCQDNEVPVKPGDAYRSTVGDGLKGDTVDVNIAEWHRLRGLSHLVVHPGSQARFTLLLEGDPSGGLHPTIHNPWLEPRPGALGVTWDLSDAPGGVP